MPRNEIELAKIFKCLSVEARVRIVQILKGQTLCVNALAARLGMTQAAVSQHLRILRHAGLVVPEKRGYWVHYQINETTLARWREAATELLAPPPLHLPCWTEPSNQSKEERPCVATQKAPAENKNT